MRTAPSSSPTSRLRGLPSLATLRRSVRRLFVFAGVGLAVVGTPDGAQARTTPCDDATPLQVSWDGGTGVVASLPCAVQSEAPVHAAALPPLPPRKPDLPVSAAVSDVAPVREGVTIPVPTQKPSVPAVASVRVASIPVPVSRPLPPSSEESAPTATISLPTQKPPAPTRDAVAAVVQPATPERGVVPTAADLAARFAGQQVCYRGVGPYEFSGKTAAGMPILVGVPGTETAGRQFVTNPAGCETLAVYAPSSEAIAASLSAAAILALPASDFMAMLPTLSGALFAELIDEAGGVEQLLRVVEERSDTTPGVLRTDYFFLDRPYPDGSTPREVIAATMPVAMARFGLPAALLPDLIRAYKSMLAHESRGDSCAISNEYRAAGLAQLGHENISGGRSGDTFNTALGFGGTVNPFSPEGLARGVAYFVYTVTIAHDGAAPTPGTVDDFLARDRTAMTWSPALQDFVRAAYNAGYGRALAAAEYDAAGNLLGIEPDMLPRETRGYLTAVDRTAHEFETAQTERDKITMAVYDGSRLHFPQATSRHLRGEGGAIINTLHSPASGAGVTVFPRLGAMHTLAIGGVPHLMQPVVTSDGQEGYMAVAGLSGGVLVTHASVEPALPTQLAMR